MGHTSMVIRWLSFFCDLENVLPAVHFLTRWLSSIIDITNCNGESASPWKKPHWIFSSTKNFPRAVNSTFRFFIASMMKFMTLSDIFIIIIIIIIQVYMLFRIF